MLSVNCCILFRELLLITQYESLTPKSVFFSFPKLMPYAGPTRCSGFAIRYMV